MPPHREVMNRVLATSPSHPSTIDASCVAIAAGINHPNPKPTLAAIARMKEITLSTFGVRPAPTARLDRYKETGRFRYRDTTPSSLLCNESRSLRDALRKCRLGIDIFPGVTVN